MMLEEERGIGIPVHSLLDAGAKRIDFAGYLKLELNLATWWDSSR